MKPNSDNLKLLIQDVKFFPNNPGIYKMYNTKDELLYIGKAKNLKRRILSYLTPKSNLDLKTQFLIQQVKRLEFIITNTEKEALILENQLIKDFKPKYNILLKDDKTYPLIKITKEFFPRIEIVREVIDDGAEYFGPLPLSGGTKKLTNLMQSLFKLRNCQQEIDPKKSQKKCILFDINKCLGPCINKIIKPEYDKLIKDLKLLLTGKSKELLRKLNKEMIEFSQKLKFEKAAEIREKIKIIENIIEKQRVNLLDNKNINIWARVEDDKFNYILVQNIFEGKLINQNGFYLEKDYGLNDFFIDTFLSYYSKNNHKLPEKIILEANLLEPLKNLTSLLKDPLNKVKFIFPKTGKNKQILDLAQKNADLALERISKYRNNIFDISILESLKNLCNLKNIPYNIMAFDVSHLSGENIVGTSVFFKNGIKEKSLYRKYIIRTVKKHKSNDPLSIFEIVLRRIKEIKDQNYYLILVDGGKPQLNYATRAINHLNAKNIDIISLAKEEELVYSNNKRTPLRLNKNDKVLLLLQKIRDEVHRFSVTFQRKQQEGFLKDTKLGKIEGLGKKRVNLLYSKFKTINEIKNSSIEKIASVGISQKLAQKIKDILNK